ncbi:hypothetical protein NE237_010131 [Protea cynaroides]|uniref:Uncharacterized protein n=1 Tax=Protea cynaroides TaxID=273540 RepID=A0A9Q0KZM2_9MAGN|nr:hypothetical protein NE237_010131 [Protea cynaroides]
MFLGNLCLCVDGFEGMDHLKILMLQLQESQHLVEPLLQLLQCVTHPNHVISECSFDLNEMRSTPAPPPAPVQGPRGLRHGLHLRASITALTFNSSGSLLISASEDCTVCLWDVSCWIVIRRFNHQKGYHVPTEVSLGCVATCLGGGVLLSLMRKSE